MVFRTVVSSIMAIGVASVTPGHSTNSESEPRYDSATVVDLTATIAEVREVPSGDPLTGEVHLVVKTERETIEVYLAPANFLKEMEAHFATNDRLLIIGSRVKLGVRFIILAREVRKENSTVYLRDQKGIPNWPPGT